MVSPFVLVLELGLESVVELMGSTVEPGTDSGAISTSPPVALFGAEEAAAWSSSDEESPMWIMVSVWSCPQSL